MEPPGEDIVVRSLEPLLEGRPDQAEADANRGSASVVKEEPCANCGATLEGPFCSQCGQRASNLQVTLGEFARDAFNSLFSFDSRLWITLRPLLIKPGFLTVEFWQGRRARYAPPLRLYLFVSFLTFFTLGTLATLRPEASPVLTTSGVASSGEVDWEAVAVDAPAPIRWFLLSVVQPAVEEPQRTLEVFFRRLPWAVFALVPVLAALLRLAYRRRQRYFVPHLVFALHFHTFVFVLLTIQGLYQIFSGRDHLDSPFKLWIAIAFFLSLRRVYGEGRWRTFAKMLMIATLYLFALLIALLVSFVLSGLR